MFNIARLMIFYKYRTHHYALNVTIARTSMTGAGALFSAIEPSVEHPLDVEDALGRVRVTRAGVEYGAVLDSGQNPDDQNSGGDRCDDDERHTDEGDGLGDSAMQRQFSLRRRVHLGEFEAIGCGGSRHPLDPGTRISRIGHCFALFFSAQPGTSDLYNYIIA